MARAITGPLSTAARGLFSGPAAGIMGVLTPTPANADEASMTVEDFAALNQGVTPTNNLPFTSMVDMAAANENFMDQFNTGEDFQMVGPLRDTNVLDGSVLGLDNNVMIPQSKPDFTLGDSDDAFESPNVKSSI